MHLMHAGMRAGWSLDALAVVHVVQNLGTWGGTGAGGLEYVAGVREYMAGVREDDKLRGVMLCTEGTEVYRGALCCVQRGVMLCTEGGMLCATGLEGASVGKGGRLECSIAQGRIIKGCRGGSGVYLGLPVVNVPNTLGHLWEAAHHAVMGQGA